MNVTETRVRENIYSINKLTKIKFLVNPLVHSVQYIGRLTKILISILEGILKKISYERRDYESVDDKSHLKLCHEKLRKKNFLQ